MYEKDADNDYGNVWAAKKIAEKMAKEVVINHPTPESVARQRHITNPLMLTKAHALVDAGAKEFASHEDVMAKLLGKI